MRRCTLLAVVPAVLALAGPVLAEEAPGAAPTPAAAQPPAAPTAETAVPTPSANVAEAPSAAASGTSAEAGWEAFDDPTFDPAATPPGEAEAVDEAPAPERRRSVVLGPEGIDDQGRRGRLHTVVPGDTLWDLSAAYLGTPWVWPSVWTDNDDIANPHLILPGDKIWITANEMRIVSDAEAEAFLSASPELAETPAAEAAAAPETFAAFEEDEPSTLEALPATVPGQAPQSLDSGRQITVSRRDAMGFVSAEQYEGSTTIVDSPVERTYLAEGDPVYLGLGEGEVEIGDEFTIFQTVEEVRDVESNRLLGYHVEVLGWAEVRQLTGDTSVSEIRMSYAEIPRGARVTPRPPSPRKVTVRSTPDAIEGQVVFLPSERTLMADGGYVYLNRGELHGVEPGSELEVFEAGRVMPDRTRGVDVRTPDHRVGRLVVVRVEPDSSVAFVLNAKRELEVGDTVRPIVPRLARR